MTLPTSYSWFPVGQRLRVPYEANQGRRVNVIGAYFSHGPCAGGFEWESRVSLPKSRAKQPRKSPEERAQIHGVTPEAVGKIDADLLVSFVWKVAGRPEGAPQGWKRERPLMVVLDNYSVHQSESVKALKEAWTAADIHLCYLPSYTPELSDIEPIWKDVKHHELRQRSYERLGDLLKSVTNALERKAIKLSLAQQSDQSLCSTT